MTSLAGAVPLDHSRLDGPDGASRRLALEVGSGGVPDLSAGPVPAVAR